MINDSAVIVDVRDNGEFNGGHREAPGTFRSLTSRSGSASFRRASRCWWCARPAGRRAITALRKAGRDQVFSLEGGLAAWRSAGLPVVK